MTLESWNYCPGVAADELDDWDYLETTGTGEGGFSPSASQDTREFIVRYDRRFDFLDDLLGFTEMGSDGGLLRTLPDQHPECPNFWCVEASYRGEGTLSRSEVGDYAQWTVARIKAVYKFPGYDLLTDNQVVDNLPNAKELQRYVVRRYGYASEFMQVSNGAIFRWVQDTNDPKTAVQMPINKPVGTTELIYTWVEVPADPSNAWIVPTLTAIQNCLGTVNIYDFDGYDPGTVLFLGVDPKMTTPRLSTTGSYYWDVTYKFAVKDNGPTTLNSSPYINPRAGWNYFYDARGAGRWDLVTGGAGAGTVGGNPMCAATDHNTLFQL